MYSLRNGYDKKHVGCGGTVRMVENVDKDTHWEFDFECMKCDSYPEANKISVTKDGEKILMSELTG